MAIREAGLWGLFSGKKCTQLRIWSSFAKEEGGNGHLEISSRDCHR